MAPNYKRGRYYNAYRTGVKAKPKVAPTVKRYVKRCMDRIVETKYVEGSITFTNPTSAGSIAGNFLCGIQLGTSDTSRVGNNIRIKNIWLKGYWSDGNNAVLRLLFAWDRQPNGAVPAVTDIITANGTNAGYNHDTVVGQGGQRFTVFSDKRTTLNLGYSGATTLAATFMHWKGDKVVQYTGNTGTVTDMISNNLVAVAVGNSTGDFTGQIVIEYQDA